jgi:hypothetical protein
MTKSEAIKIPMTTVAGIGTIGPYHADINGENKKSDGTKTIRGPFNIVPVPANTVPTYPVLWSHDAEREGAMSFDGDMQAQTKSTKDQDEREAADLKAAAVWASASHCHFNQNFRFNSQPTAMQFTSRRTIGGRAWTSILLATEDQEKALVLWGNTSLGLLVHWWIANKQQSGRGNITPNVLEHFPVWDVAALKPDHLKKAAKVFDEISQKKLLPIHEIDKDATRLKLDERFARQVLGLSESIIRSGGPLELLRMKLAQEPSIRGNK